MSASSTVVSDGRAPLSSLTSGVALICYVALLRMVLYALAGSQYGYFRDELYYLACGQHPAWGYVDQPPLIGWMAWLLQHTLGTSIWALRLLPALAGAATAIVAGLLAREFGGRRWAMLLASVSTMLVPVALELTHLFTMNAFDPLFWTCIAFLIVRISKTGNQRLWIGVGALAGITILNKYAVVFWLCGLLIGILMTPLRQSLGQRWVWFGTAAAAVIALPNLLWQWQHQFPFLELMENVRRGGRDVSLPPFSYLKAQAEMLGYVAPVLVILAMLFFFSKRGRPFRSLGWAYLVFLALMLALRGKMYYVAPVYPMMFAAGAAWMESDHRQRGWSWSMAVLILSVTASGAIYAPTVLPILSVPSYLAYEERMGVTQQKFENQPQGALPQLYADMFGWQEIAETVGAYYRTLSPEDQKKTAIFANNFGEGGAIDFFGPRYGLPKAIGNHQNYWIWGPREYTGESLIVLGDADVRNMETKCASFSTIGSTKHPRSRPDEWIPIYHCRGFKWNLKEIWPTMKRFN